MNARTLNLIGALPLFAWYLWSLSRQLPLLLVHLASIRYSIHVDVSLALQTLAQISSIAFTTFLIILLVVRDVPRVQARGFPQYLSTIVGTCAATAFFLLPPAQLSAAAFAAATLLIVLGFGLSLYALIYLGRSFAVLPSARKLVVDGPYRLVRHPLYLFEEIAILGIMIQFVQPWSLLLLLVHAAAQLARMHYEERALTEAFPEYSPYADRTARLIPGVY